MIGLVNVILFTHFTVINLRTGSGLFSEIGSGHLFFLGRIGKVGFGLSLTGSDPQLRNMIATVTV